MPQASRAAQTISVGKLQLVFDAAACEVTGDSGRHPNFGTWDTLPDSRAGEYGLLFMNGNVRGHARRSGSLEAEDGVLPSK